MDRRTFFSGAGALGAGLVLGFHIPERNRVFAQAPAGFDPGAAPPNAFVRIAPDNRITILSKHTELGQGIYTGLATLVAEELDADWTLVQVEAAPADVDLYRHFMLGIQGTGGSRSISNSWLQYRTIGAQARAMLVQAAADAWGVAPDSITTRDSRLIHDASGRSASYGDLSEAAAGLPVPRDVRLKTHDEYRLIGQDLRKVDNRAKVDGSATYTIDVQRPGMLVAVVAHPPRFGARLVRWDDSETRAIPGVVEVVEIPRGVAVLARNTWTAIQGRNALETEWDFSEAENRSSEDIVRDFTALTEATGTLVEQRGDAEAALSKAYELREATYVFPYLAHAAMEPLDCTIELMNDGRCVIRSGTQMPSVEQERVAEVLDMPQDQVEVEVVYAGGGFGRRGNFIPDLEVEAASILKATDGRYPIKLIYTREDDTRAGFYRPLFVHRLRGSVDADGNLSAWTSRVVGQSFVDKSMFSFLIQNGVDNLAVEGSHDLPYHVDNTYMDFHMAQAGVPPLAWRSVGHSHTSFSRETFLDELLNAAGRDPVEGRLALMQDERGKAVIRKAAELADWGRPAEEGRGLGIAYSHSFSTRVAEVAEVSLDDSGQIRVDKVWAVVDCGTAVNPNIIAAQIEGGIMYGLSAALFGSIDIENGEVKTGNFDNYPILRMHQAPAIEVFIMPSREEPTGIGEPGLPPIAPAVANAYFQLSGKRLYRMPFNREV